MTLDKVEAGSAFLRRVPTQNRSRAKVLRVLIAAEALLPELGYQAFTVSPAKLIQRAGVSGGSFYAYFRDSAAVLDVLTMAYLEEAEHLLDEVASKKYENWEAAADAVSDAYVDFFRDPAKQELWLHRMLSGRLAQRADDVDWVVARQMKGILERDGQGDSRGSEFEYRLACEIGSRLTEFAFKHDPKGDPRAISCGKQALKAYLSTLTADSSPTEAPLRSYAS